MFAYFGILRGQGGNQTRPVTIRGIVKIAPSSFFQITAKGTGIFCLLRQMGFWVFRQDTYSKNCRVIFFKSKAIE